jgi:ATP-dependent protease HslVU (ClpYQ) ATPase subunit|tara:strand:- start:1083 stop:1481 length:399 start_codon:yes stop_codon:yes gene_type:complete
MSKDLLKSVMENDQESVQEQALSLISERIEKTLNEKMKDIASEMMKVTEEVEHSSAFAEVITQCLDENININLELNADERITVTPEVAKVISETHDELPSEFQKSFRETIFESEKKYHTILESIISGELNDD